MSTKISFLKTGFFLFNHFISRRTRNPKPKYQKYPSLLHENDLSRHTLIFDVEGALLKSEALFPYFMLVAFEAGGVIRSIILFALCPLILLLNDKTGLKMMVMVCFLGVKKDGFRAGRAVLAKHFLEDVGFEIFELLQRGGKRVGVSDLPHVMIEGFLKDYLEIDFVVGRELKVFNGYFLGIMEDRNKDFIALERLFQEEKLRFGNAIGIASFNKPFDHRIFSCCKEIYMVRKSDKETWQTLPRNKYPKPLVFHDGRLALRPNPLATLAMFMWAPFGFFLSLARGLVALTLPYDACIPMLAFSGLRITVAKPDKGCHVKDSDWLLNRRKGVLYVCNHRTLLDPLYVSFALRRKSLAAVTYSLSRVSEILAPIKTVRLTRDRDLDGQMMGKLLNQGDLVVCPEGTTCREPYLLRFSPLFAEVSDVIIPVAMDSSVSFFHGTTASGLKALDPLFFLMDPAPTYTVRFLHPVAGTFTCRDSDGESRFQVANHVQGEIGRALSFKCTCLTRKDKYLILAGTNGLVNKI